MQQGEKSMYNLFVSADATAWDGSEWICDLDRCIREYTDPELIKTYGDLNPDSIAKLKSLPCVFAYESVLKRNPKFGLIREIAVRRGQVRVDFELIDVSSFPDDSELDGLAFSLDIGRWELNRTHWALKDVVLPRELGRSGFFLPAWTSTSAGFVDVSSHIFEVGLSFPGEVRPLVLSIAKELERLLGPHRYFYDENYTAQLASPSIDLLLQSIYRERSKLIVAFIGSDYQKKALVWA